MRKKPEESPQPAEHVARAREAFLRAMSETAAPAATMPDRDLEPLKIDERRPQRWALSANALRAKRPIKSKAGPPKPKRR